MQDNSRSAAVTATGVRTGALDRHTHEVDAHPIDGEADQSIGDEPASPGRYALRCPRSGYPGRASDRAAVIDLEKLTRALSAVCSPSTRQVGALNLVRILRDGRKLIDSARLVSGALSGSNASG